MLLTKDRSTSVGKAARDLVRNELKDTKVKWEILEPRGGVVRSKDERKSATTLVRPKRPKASEK